MESESAEALVIGPPDSNRLAFTTTTRSDPITKDSGTLYDLRLFVADATTGEVDEIADLGQCQIRRSVARTESCTDQEPALAWAPDGQSLTVLWNSTLNTYDPTGKVLGSEPTDIVTGPLMWLESD